MKITLDEQVDTQPLFVDIPVEILPRCTFDTSSTLCTVNESIVEADIKDTPYLTQGDILRDSYEIQIGGE